MVDFSKYQKKDAALERKKIVREKEGPKLKPKTKTQKSTKKTVKPNKTKNRRNGFSPSLELNLIKALYANRFGSTTNKIKSHMVNKIIRAWRN